VHPNLAVARIAVRLGDYLAAGVLLLVLMGAALTRSPLLREAPRWAFESMAIRADEAKLLEHL